MPDTTNYNYGYPVETPKETAETTATSYNKTGMPTPPAGWGKALGTNPIKSPDEC